MAVNYIYPEQEVVRNYDRCISCRACERQCANEAHSYIEAEDKVVSDDSRCVSCHRCVSICPTRALKIVPTDHAFRKNASWSKTNIYEVY
jgi:ferredoxin